MESRKKQGLSGLRILASFGPARLAEGLRGGGVSLQGRGGQRKTLDFDGKAPDL